MHKLASQLQGKNLLIKDGAIGTELERRGVDIGLPLWSANSLIGSPDAVFQIHRDYIEAGADVIVTNTFRTNRRAFRSAQLQDRSFELTQTAVELAHQARNRFSRKEILIAGCIAPVEDCYKPELVPSEQELFDEHAEHCERLVKLDVDFLLVETMTTIREAFAAGKAAKCTGREFVISFSCKQDGTLYGGESLADAVTAVARLEPAIISLNCISPRYLTPLIKKLQLAIHNLQSEIPFGVYGNVGKPDVREGKMIIDVEPYEYVDFAKEWRDLGAVMIGGCCGTTPEYIRLLQEHL